jgi:hypothetical protein
MEYISNNVQDLRFSQRWLRRNYPAKIYRNSADGLGKTSPPSSSVRIGQTGNITSLCQLTWLVCYKDNTAAYPTR